MNLIDVVLGIVVANAFCTVVPLIAGVVGLVVLAAWATTKERRLLRRLKVRKLWEYRYVSETTWVITYERCKETGHPLQNWPELVENGVFVLRQFARSPEEVGKPDQQGRIKYTLDRWCGDGFNIRSIMIDPQLVEQQK